MKTFQLIVLLQLFLCVKWTLVEAAAIPVPPGPAPTPFQFDEQSFDDYGNTNELIDLINTIVKEIEPNNQFNIEHFDPTTDSNRLFVNPNIRHYFLVALGRISPGKNVDQRVILTPVPPAAGGGGGAVPAVGAQAINDYSYFEKYAYSPLNTDVTVDLTPVGLTPENILNGFLFIFDRKNFASAANFLDSLDIPYLKDCRTLHEKIARLFFIADVTNIVYLTLVDTANSMTSISVNKDHVTEISTIWGSFWDVRHINGMFFSRRNPYFEVANQLLDPSNAHNLTNADLLVDISFYKVFSAVVLFYHKFPVQAAALTGPSSQTILDNLADFSNGAVRYYELHHPNTAQNQNDFYYMLYTSTQDSVKNVFRVLQDTHTFCSAEIPDSSEYYMPTRYFADHFLSLKDWIKENIIPQDTFPIRRLGHQFMQMFDETCTAIFADQAQYNAFIDAVVDAPNLNAAANRQSVFFETFFFVFPTYEDQMYFPSLPPQNKSSLFQFTYFAKLVNDQLKNVQPEPASFQNNALLDEIKNAQFWKFIRELKNYEQTIQNRIPYVVSILRAIFRVHYRIPFYSIKVNVVDQMLDVLNFESLSEYKNLIADIEQYIGQASRSNSAEQYIGQLLRLYVDPQAFFFETFVNYAESSLKKNPFSGSEYVANYRAFFDALHCAFGHYKDFIASQRANSNSQGINGYLYFEDLLDDLYFKCISSFVSNMLNHRLVDFYDTTFLPATISSMMSVAQLYFFEPITHDEISSFAPSVSANGAFYNDLSKLDGFEDITTLVARHPYNSEAPELNPIVFLIKNIETNNALRELIYEDLPHSTSISGGARFVSLEMCDFLQKIQYSGRFHAYYLVDLIARALRNRFVADAVKNLFLDVFYPGMPNLLAVSISPYDGQPHMEIDTAVKALGNAFAIRNVHLPLIVLKFMNIFRSAASAKDSFQVSSSVDHAFLAHVDRYLKTYQRTLFEATEITSPAFDMMALDVASYSFFPTHIFQPTNYFTALFVAAPFASAFQQQDMQRYLGYGHAIVAQFMRFHCFFYSTSELNVYKSSTAILQSIPYQIGIGLNRTFPQNFHASISSYYFSLRNMADNFCIVKFLLQLENTFQRSDQESGSMQNRSVHLLMQNFQNNLCLFDAFLRKVVYNFGETTLPASLSQTFIQKRLEFLFDKKAVVELLDILATNSSVPYDLNTQFWYLLLNHGRFENSHSEGSKLYSEYFKKMYLTYARMFHSHPEVRLNEPLHVDSKKAIPDHLMPNPQNIYETFDFSHVLTMQGALAGTQKVADFLTALVERKFSESKYSTRCLSLRPDFNYDAMEHSTSEVHHELFTTRPTKEAGSSFTPEQLHPHTQFDFNFYGIPPEYNHLNSAKQSASATHRPSSSMAADDQEWQRNVQSDGAVSYRIPVNQFLAGSSASQSSQSRSMPQSSQGNAEIMRLIQSKEIQRRRQSKF